MGTRRGREVYFRPPRSDRHGEENAGIPLAKYPVGSYNYRPSLGQVICAAAYLRMVQLPTCRLLGSVAQGGIGGSSRLSGHILFR